MDDLVTDYIQFPNFHLPLVYYEILLLHECIEFLNSFPSFLFTLNLAYSLTWNIISIYIVDDFQFADFQDV